MTYEELVLKVRDIYENADARQVYEHVAVQVNVTGEAAGAFYIEIANRQICVEPYDYYDRDVLVTVDTQVILDILNKTMPYADALTSGAIRIEGNPQKIDLLQKVKLKAPKKAVKKAAENPAPKAPKKTAENPAPKKAEDAAAKKE